MIISNVECSSEIDDTEDMELLLHPLQFRIDGVPAAGAIVGNIALWACVVGVFTLVVYILSYLNIGVKRNEYQGEVSSWVKASSLLRFPSVLMPVPLLLVAGVVQSSFDIVFHPRDSTAVNVIGYFGLIATAAFTAFLWKVSTVPMASIQPLQEPRGAVGRFFLGSKEWKAYDDCPLYVERNGVVFDTHNELKWLRGKYFMLEVIIVYPIAALVSVKSNDFRICALKMALVAAILIGHTILVLWQKVFLVPFLTAVVVVGNVLMIIGLCLYVIAYSAKDMKYWTVDPAAVFFVAAMITCLVRALYDLCMFARDLYEGYKAADREKALKEALIEDDSENDRLELVDIDFMDEKERHGVLEDSSALVPPDSPTNKRSLAGSMSKRGRYTSSPLLSDSVSSEGLFQPSAVLMAPGSKLSVPPLGASRSSRDGIDSPARSKRRIRPATKSLPL